MHKTVGPLLAAVALIAGGCAPALIGAGAAGGYKTATDRRTVGTMSDDATLSARVKTALVRDAEVAARRTDLDVVDCRVMLSSVVDDPAVY